MNIDDFICENEIVIFVDVNLETRKFDIRKTDKELESYDLFEQLILFSNITALQDNIKEQLLPRIWTQGNIKCVICQPNEYHIIVVFYDRQIDAKENFYLAQKLDSQLKELF